MQRTSPPAKPSSPSTRRSAKSDLTATQTYNISGKRFIVEPIFKEPDETQSIETLGEIILKLILEN